MKILVTYACAGVGHKKATLAVSDALSEFKDVELTTVDALDYTNAVFKFSYPRIYLFLINRMPNIWGFFYYLLDWKIVDIFLAGPRRFINNIQAKRFINFIVSQNPDVVVCTHFFSAEVLSVLKRKNKFSGKLITVVTDFLPHSFWLARESDYFIAAIERTKKDLIRRGIKEERIKVLGIPCEPKFAISRNRRELEKGLGLEQGFFNLLIMGGGFGTGPVRKIVNRIYEVESKIREGIQLIVICGKNKKLFEQLKIKKSDSRVRLHIFGFMDNIDEFMGASDCIITKSGGLTVSESLSKQLPMIIVRPIPGQETRNCKILVGYGTAVRADSVKGVINYIREFILFPERIIGMRTRIKLLAYPNAAKDIAEFTVGRKV